MGRPVRHSEGIRDGGGSMLLPEIPNVSDFAASESLEFRLQGSLESP
jgi:hypothetical protein